MTNISIHLLSLFRSKGYYISLSELETCGVRNRNARDAIQAARKEGLPNFQSYLKQQEKEASLARAISLNQEKEQFRSCLADTLYD